MCAQYLPPIQPSVPVYNPNNFPSITDDISIQEGNSLYVQTGTANQSVKGTKTFLRLDTDDLRIIGDGTPITWVRGPSLTTVLENQAGNPFNQIFQFPNYLSPTVDTLVAETNIAVLSGKTLNSFKVGQNGTSTNNTLVQHGRASISGSGSFLITFPTAFAAGTTPTLNVSFAQGNVSFLFVFQLTGVTNTGFTYRQYLITIANPALCGIAGDPHTVHWNAIGTA
jgi:hypothetical protein